MSTYSENKFFKKAIEDLSVEEHASLKLMYFFLITSRELIEHYYSRYLELYPIVRPTFPITEACVYDFDNPTQENPEKFHFNSWLFHVLTKMDIDSIGDMYEKFSILLSIARAKEFHQPTLSETLTEKCTIIDLEKYDTYHLIKNRYLIPLSEEFWDDEELIFLEFRISTYPARFNRVEILRLELEELKNIENYISRLEFKLGSSSKGLYSMLKRRYWELLEAQLERYENQKKKTNSAKSEIGFSNFELATIFYYADIGDLLESKRYNIEKMKSFIDKFEHEINLGSFKAEYYKVIGRLDYNGKFDYPVGTLESKILPYIKNKYKKVTHQVLDDINQLKEKKYNPDK